MILTVTLNPSLDEWIELPTLAIGELNRAGGLARYPGGKGINVSRVIHEMRGQSRALGFAGGHDGHILQTLLDRLKIPHTFVPIAGSTRNNYKIRTKHPDALTEINTAGPSIPSASLRRLEQLLTHWIGRAHGVVCSGSLPRGVPATIYRRWIQTARSRGRLTVLDASGEPLRRGVSAKPWLIKPNRHEAEELAGRRLPALRDVVRAAHSFTRMGPELAVVSLGKEGSVLAARDQSQVWMARPPQVRVNSVVGAGDSFVAGFVMGWLRSRSLMEAMRWGSACGAATAIAPGTELGRWKDVQRLLRRVRITRLKAAGSISRCGVWRRVPARRCPPGRSIGSRCRAARLARTQHPTRSPAG